MCVSRCVYVCACRYVSMHSFVLVLLHACKLFRNRYTLTKHPTPSPFLSTQPSTRSPTLGGRQAYPATGCAPKDDQDSRDGSHELAQMQPATANAGFVRPSRVVQKRGGP